MLSSAGSGDVPAGHGDLQSAGADQHIGRHRTAGDPDRVGFVIVGPGAEQGAALLADGGYDVGTARVVARRTDLDAA